jgi:phosphoglycerate dehydrogenase-like enzyme
MKIHLIQHPTEEALDLLIRYLKPDIELSFGIQIPDPAEYEVLVGGVPTREFIESSPYLKSLIIPWAGLPTATRELMLEFPKISVHNLHHNAPPTAEMALALLFSAAKFIIPYDKALRDHDWTPRYQPNPSMLLQGKTVLILGYGAIGQFIGKVLKAMGMRIIGIRRKIDVKMENGVEIFSVDSMKQLLPQADVLMIALPGTPETEGLISEQELALLPPGAVLVNVGRGPIVDSEALYNSLRDGHLRAAGLDVWYNYPSDPESRTHTRPADFPFHELENIVMSPHRGGGSEDSERLRMEYLSVLLNTAAAGEVIPNKVDLQAGY